MKWSRIKAGEYQAGAWTVRRFRSPPNGRGRRDTTWEVWHHNESLYGSRDSLAAGKAFADALATVHGEGLARKLHEQANCDQECIGQ